MSKPESDTIQLILGAERRDDVQLLAAEGEKARRFRMVAYTGAEFDRWYGRAVIDMSGIEGPDKLPILLNHRESEVVGYADERTQTKEGLVLSGVISRATPAGQQVAKLSDEGFPFTASMGVAVMIREELSDGATTKVNGREVRGPLSIWRKSRLGESSFVTAFPADKDTEAHALMSKTAQQLMQQNLPPASAETAATPAPTAAPAPDAAALRAEGEKLAGERLVRLTAAIPGRPEFVLAQFAKGNDVLQAKAELADLLLSERAQAEQAGKQGDTLRSQAGLPPAGTPLVFLGADRQAAGELPRTEQLKHMAPEEAAEQLMRRGEYHDAFKGDKRACVLYLAAERRGLVKPDVVQRMVSAMGGIERLSWGRAGPDYAQVTVKGIIGAYYKALELELEGNWATRLGVMMPSDQETETYRWLGHAPMPREWHGTRLEKAAPIRSFQITNKIFEATMPVDVEDYRFDKTGQIMIRIGELASRMGQHWQKLITDLITDDGLCYDGQNFFDTDHVMGGEYTTAQSNELTSANLAALNVTAPATPTRNELLDVMIALAGYAYSFKDNFGEPYNGGAKEFVLMVPASMHGAAVAASRDSLVNQGESNSLKNQNFVVTPLVNPRLTWGSAVVYLFRVDSAMKPFILQEPEGVQLEFLGPGSDHAFKNNQYLYGSKAVRNAGYGEWAHAIKATLS